MKNYKEGFFLYFENNLGKFGSVFFLFLDLF